MGAIAVENVSVEYAVHEYKYSTLKEYVVQRLRGQSGARKIVALDQVNLSIAPGEAVALVGHNGSGKSTLLKVIAGIITPTQGAVSAAGRIAPMIELGTGFDPELSGRENIFLSCTIMGFSKKEILAVEDDIISFSELGDFINLPLKNYSSGMYARLGFACATAIRPEILIVDEVLAVGDSNFSRKCLERINELKAGGTTFILVSHDANTVMSFCDRGIVLESGQVRFDGPIQNAILTHSEIMDRRYVSRLSEAQRAEMLRKLQLERNEARRAVTPRPHVTCRHWLEQDGSEQTTIRSDGPFDVCAEVSIRECDKLGAPVNVGFGVNTAAGVRVAGLNLGHCKTLVTQQQIAEAVPFKVSFRFPGGLPCLASGKYQLVISVMDHENTRHLVHVSPLAFEVIAPSDEHNFDGDVITLGSAAVVAEIRFSS